MAYSSEQMIQAARALAAATTDTDLQSALTTLLAQTEPNIGKIQQTIQQQADWQAAYKGFLQQVAVGQTRHFQEPPNPHRTIEIDASVIYRCPAEGGCSLTDCEFYHTKGAWLNLYNEAIPSCPKCQQPLRQIV